MPQISKAALFIAPQQPLALRDCPLPELSSGEVLVEVTMCTLCGSDLHTYQGHRQSPTPSVLGHEIIGKVAELPAGEKVCDLKGRPLEMGDRISWSVAVSCGQCYFCENQLPQKCETLFKYGHEALSETSPPSGGLAEYCLLRAGTAIVSVPENLPDDIACPANCATATVAAALRVAGDCRGRCVLIQGAGLLGLTAAAMAKTRGADQVIVTDVNSTRLEEVARFGATHVVNVSHGIDELQQVVDSSTENRGVDIVLEMSGSSPAAEAVLQFLRIGGRCVLVGSVFPGPSISISPEAIVRKMWRIEGMHNYTPEDLLTAFEFLSEAQHRFPFSTLVGNRYSLEETNAAIEHALGSPSFRTAVLPGSH